MALRLTPNYHDLRVCRFLLQTLISGLLSGNHINIGILRVEVGFARGV